MDEPDAPVSVRIAGVLVGVQGLAGFGYAIAVLVGAFTHTRGAVGNLYAEAGFFAVLGAAVVAVGLLRGQPWTRTPATVLQLIFLGIAWYVFGPSGQVIVGVVTAVFCVATLVLLFTARARAWAVGIRQE
ncbi:MAG TPA: hypothetical protein VHZ97_28335 [Pseudonocardiaceae bacterium]|nr:hypothetical protein [Pseudonocardiaceae bacterium]